MRLEPMKIVQCAIFFVKIEYKKNNSNNKWIKKNNCNCMSWCSVNDLVCYITHVFIVYQFTATGVYLQVFCEPNNTNGFTCFHFFYFSLLILCDSNPSTWFFKICTFSSLYYFCFFFYFSIFLEFCAVNEFEYSKNIAHNSCKYYSLKKEDCNQMNFNL